MLNRLDPAVATVMAATRKPLEFGGRMGLDGVLRLNSIGPALDRAGSFKCHAGGAVKPDRAANAPRASGGPT
jgi:hypothetical protein